MAILKIYNPIVSEGEKAMMYAFTGEEGICFKDVQAFVASMAEDDEVIDLRLHCQGGSVHEGWAIVDALRATGKKIKATIEGNCASMASVVLLAASERRAYPHATLHIHKPFYPNVAGDFTSDDLAKLCSDLTAIEERMLDFYVERTGAERSVIADLMAEDKDIDMKQAKKLGFVHKILPPMSASVTDKQAISATKNNNQMSKKNAIAAALKGLADALGFKAVEAVAYELTTESGETLTIEKPDGEDPAIGDRAYPDGEHRMPDGTIIVVVDETITDIVAPTAKPTEEKPAEETPEKKREDAEKRDAELAEKDARIAELEAEVAEKDARIAELEAELEKSNANAKSREDIHALKVVELAGGVKAIEKLASTYTPSRRENDMLPANRGGNISERPSKIREKLDNYRK